MKKMYLFALEDERNAYLSGLKEPVHGEGSFFVDGPNAYGITGVGKVFSAMNTERFLATFKPDLVINIGVAGGINRTTNDWIVVNETLFYDVDVTAFNYQWGQYPKAPATFKASKNSIERLINHPPKDKSIHSGWVATGDRFLTDVSPLERIEKEVLAVDMELASIALVCEHHEVPWISIKTISDTVGTPSQIDDFDRWVKEGLRKLAPWIEGALN